MPPGGVAECLGDSLGRLVCATAAFQRTVHQQRVDAARAEEVALDLPGLLRVPGLDDLEEGGGLVSHDKNMMASQQKCNLKKIKKIS